MTQFTRDDLIDIEYALKNLIEDKQDFAPGEPDTAEQVTRLEDLRARVQGMLRAAHKALAEQPAPVQQEQEVLGKRCIDGGKCHHDCKDKCFRRECCSPLSGYAGVWAYSAPQARQPAQQEPTPQEQLDTALRSLDFYRRRVQALEQWQSKMRDPERTVVCDIIANGCTLEPAGDRYKQPAQRQPLTDEEIDRVTDAQWASNNHKPVYAAHRAYARAIEAAHGIKGDA
jgi:hypothetical protein